MLKISLKVEELSVFFYIHFSYSSFFKGLNTFEISCFTANILFSLLHFLFLSTVMINLLLINFSFVKLNCINLKQTNIEHKNYSNFKKKFFCVQKVRCKVM